jgi:flagellar hook-associated protein FlgK
MEGLVYLLNQSGIALAQATARINELEQQLASLQNQVSDAKEKSKPSDKK